LKENNAGLLEDMKRIIKEEEESDNKAR